MANIAPFRALRPQPKLASLVASRPYDVLSSEEARMEAAGNPDSFLHITKSEIDLPPHQDPHQAPVYQKAKSNLEDFLARGVLLRETSPCYYIYQLVRGHHQQTGLVCVSAVADYENGVIKKHELTRPDKEQDRILHIQTTMAQTGNVFLTYRSQPRIHQLIEDWKASHHPVYDFQAEDQVIHRVWVVNDPATIQRITEWFAQQVPATYIADGHHRAASAAKVRQNLGALAGPGADYFLTTLFPSDQLEIQDYNRVVKDLNGFTSEELIDRLQQDFFIGRVGAALRPGRPHEFGLYLGAGAWFQLVAKEGSFRSDPIGVLDVTILQENVLSKFLGIGDPRTDKRIDFVGGIRGLEFLEALVDTGKMKAAFSLYPVSIQQLFDIADTGAIMPPKSTWFEPKLRDGLLTHLLNGS